MSKVAECTILSSTCTISNQICPLAVCYACACVREWSGIIRKREAEWVSEGEREWVGEKE